MFEQTLTTLDLFGVAVFAISGVIAAAQSKQRIDLFGVIVLATVTALGGGTLRDVVMGTTPAIWVEDSLYLIVTTLTALMTFTLLRLSTQIPKQIPRLLLETSDAIGLAVFTVIGMEKALRLGFSPIVAIVMGVMTGVFGGILRDVLVGKTPHILREEIYATAALLGALVYLLLTQLLESPLLSLGLAILTTLIVRLIAIRHRLKLPTLT